MFGAINSVISSVFGVGSEKSEAETQAMFDAVDNGTPKRRKPATKATANKPKPAAAKVTEPMTKSQKAKARKAKGKARRAEAAKRLQEARRPTAETPYHHEPVTTVTQTNVYDKPAATPAARTSDERRLILEILHAATVA